MINIEKLTFDVYRIVDREQMSWGYIAVNFGDESAHIMAHSDYGNYAFMWKSTGPDSVKFLCNIGMDYAMNKMNNGNITIPDYEARNREIIRMVESLENNPNVSTDDFEEHLFQIQTLVEEYGYLDDDGGWPDELENHIGNTSWWWEYFDYIPDLQTKYDPQIEGFWNHIWIPFIEQLKKDKGVL